MLKRPLGHQASNFLIPGAQEFYLVWAGYFLWVCQILLEGGSNTFGGPNTFCGLNTFGGLNTERKANLPGLPSLPSKRRAHCVNIARKWWNAREGRPGNFAFPLRGR